LSILQIQTPRVFTPLLKPSRYKGAKGGRGSGKSWFFGSLLIEEHIADQSQASVCVREIQKSLDQSVKRLLEQTIAEMNAGYYFEIQDAKILSNHGSGLIIFQGMQNHTSDSIKSLEGFKRAWVEEAQSLSQRSLDLLRPTIRAPDSELWFSWNPEKDSDPIDVLLCGENPPPDSIVVHANYSDNPFLPDVLREEMEYDKARDFEKYLHVWEGKYKKISEAIVFKNWRVEEFDTEEHAEFKFGADWGFATDPTTLIRCFMRGEKDLYIDYEAYMVGCEINQLPDLFDSVPQSTKWFIRADSARPETISYMQKHGYPKVIPAKKGSGSVDEGIEFLRGFNIHIHPRCVETIKEFSNYQYKVDPKTDEILPILIDKNNHCIDAIRYAMEGYTRAKRVETYAPTPSIVNHWR
jgi:phage terminase large subunit